MAPTQNERLGIGRGAEVFAWGNGRVIKLMREPGHGAWLERELLAQRAAIDAGVGAPAPFEIIEHEGRPGLVMERVDGLDGLSLVNRKPWLVWKVGAQVGRLHRSLRDVAAPLEIVPLRESVRRELTESPTVPDRARGRLLAILDSLPDTDRLCHMDFHIGNVIMAASGPVVIDFASARRGDPVADYAQSLVLLEAGSPVEMGMWERLLVLFGRRLVRMAYVNGYGRLSSDDTRRAVLWRPVLIGSRLAEGIPEERQVLLKMLGRALRRAEAS